MEDRTRGAQYKVWVWSNKMTRNFTQTKRKAGVYWKYSIIFQWQCTNHDSFKICKKHYLGKNGKDCTDIDNDTYAGWCVMKTTSKLNIGRTMHDNSIYAGRGWAKKWRDRLLEELFIGPYISRRSSLLSEQTFSVFLPFSPFGWCISRAVRSWTAHPPSLSANAYTLAQL